MILQAFLASILTLLLLLPAQAHNQPINNLLRAIPGENLWDSMEYDLYFDNQEERPAVQQQIHWHYHHKKYLGTLIQRAAPYLSYIYQETQKRHMPAEIALLPFIESEYDPFAYSAAGATGLWQLMPGTATGFHLTINWWYDGRRDVVLSTQAALDYLTYLYHHYHNDWLLALAAYNAGESTINQAIRNNQKHHRATDFWSLMLPKETQAYIPKLLAFSALVYHHGDGDIPLPFVHTAPYFTAVPITTPIDLSQAAHLAHLSLYTLRQLNPQFRRWTTQHGTAHPLLLIPTEKTAHFTSALRHLHKTHHRHTPHHHRKPASIITEDHIPGPRSVTHIIRHNDSLYKIAHHYRVTPTQLMFWNGIRSHRTHLHPGQRLIIWKKPRLRYYTVEEGDSLLGIAYRHHTTLAYLQKINHLSNDFIKIGERLKIPA